MPFYIRSKVDSVYRSLYISLRLVERIEQLAAQHDTSFNHFVVCMIEHCLDDDRVVE